MFVVVAGLFSRNPDVFADVCPVLAPPKLNGEPVAAGCDEPNRPVPVLGVGEPNAPNESFG